MTCTWYRMPDGGVAILRHAPPRRRRCKACGQPATPDDLRECDWKVGIGKTCDLLICINCTYEPAPEKDLCPEHAKEWQRRLSARANADRPRELV